MKNVTRADDNTKRLKDPINARNAGLDSYGRRTHAGYPATGSGKNDVPNPGSTDPLCIECAAPGGKPRHIGQSQYKP